ncbi:hypothetical protein C4J81_13075 [Deltaproteobacteria bacterium Smac51]|nr:hypothetical protein C4J81_13075 [Deltaproteobacteria bacterium Smac51]
MKTRKISIAAILLGLLMVPLFVSGCVMTSDNAIIEQSASKKVPDVSGAFTNNNNETYTLNLLSGTTNSFTATAPDSSQLIVSLEPLKKSNRFVVQIKNPSEATVLLTICTLEKGKISIYDLNNEAVNAMAGKYGLTIVEGGHIQKFKSFPRLMDFFEACFDPKYSRIATTIEANKP